MTKTKDAPKNYQGEPLTTSNDRWKTSQDEFRGYARAMLETLHSELRSIRDILAAEAIVRKELSSIVEQRCLDKHTKLDKRLLKIDKKVAGIAATVAIILTALGYFLKPLIEKVL